MASSQGRTWVEVVDQVLDRGDRFLDRFRKTPRRRLEVVPSPPASPDPFAVAAAPAAPPKTEAPLGDPGLAAQLYGRRTCEVTGRALQLLRERSIVARMIDLDDPDNLGLEARLIKQTKGTMTPYVFVRGQYVGGFDQLAERVKRGESFE